MARLVLSALLACLSLSLHAATRIWTGAVNDRWSNPGNWDTGAPQAGDEIVFLHGRAVTINDLPAGMSLHSIFATEGPWTFHGNAIAVTNGIVTKTTAFTMPIKVGAPQQFTAFCCHIIEFFGGIDLNGQTLTLRSSSMNGDSGIDVNGKITGAGALLFSAQRLRLGIDDALPLVPAVLTTGTFDMNDKSASLRSFEMHANTIFAAGNKPLIVTERVRLAGELTLRNALDGMTIIRNDGSAPVEGAFERIPATYTVSYNGGDGNDVVVHTSGVSLIATTTTLTSAINPAHAGTPVTFTASVFSSSGPPSGTVSFRDDSATLATVPLNASGVAMFTTMLSPGVHDITATYDGSSTHALSVSATLTQIIAARRRRAVEK